jgi:endonuclease/exonuclease/phosphatase (EEP) superfamily protein YafD
MAIKGRFFYWVVILAAASGCAHETHLTQADIRLYSELGDVVQRSMPDSLVCVSYNIEYGEKLENALADLTDHPRLKNPDILMLQEMDSEGVALLAARLGMNFAYYPSFIHPHHGKLFGTAVLSPWPLSEPGHLLLPHPNPLSDNRRTALAVDILIGSRTVRAVSVHLSTLSVDFEDRLEQATLVGDSLVADTGPAIIAGDFNSGSPREGILFRRVFRKAGFREARLPVERTATGGPLDWLGIKLKLDRIYYRELEMISSGSPGESTASDHFPVWSVFRWRD